MQNKQDNNQKMNILANKKPLVEMNKLGVKYNLAFKREDLQSLTYKLLDRNSHIKKDFWALKDLSFSGYAGDIIGIIGPNGAGKTTLCRIISGLLKPDQGLIRVNGSVEALFTLGTGFVNELTGRENIIMNGLMLGFCREQIDRLIPKIIDFSGLGRFIDEPIKKYSSGMKARLGFSIAVMTEPEILVIDEALSAGDLEFRKKAAQKMKELVTDAKLVIIVSHSASFIKNFCNRVLWLEKGLLRASGPPELIVPEYLKTIPHQPPPVVPEIELQPTTSESGNTAVVTAKKINLKYYLTAEHSKNISSWRKKEQFYAIKDVSFSIYENEIVGIIGPNGAGKTTLCQIMAGILKVDSGILNINGDTTALLSFGTGFNIQLTGRDNVFLNGLMMGIPKNILKNLYQEIVDFSDIGSYILQPVKNYSRGMKARLGFSVAAMLTPDIFIIDEALNAGDASFYEKASTRIQDMIGKAKSVIVVTHNLNFIEKVCTRAMWMQNGTIIHDGDPSETVEKYSASVDARKVVAH